MLTYFLTDAIKLTAAIDIINAENDDDTSTVIYDGESIAFSVVRRR